MRIFLISFLEAFPLFPIKELPQKSDSENLASDWHNVFFYMNSAKKKVYEQQSIS